MGGFTSFCLGCNCFLPLACKLVVTGLLGKALMLLRVEEGKMEKEFTDEIKMRHASPKYRN